MLQRQDCPVRSQNLRPRSRYELPRNPVVSARGIMCRPHDSGYPMDPSPNARSLGLCSRRAPKAQQQVHVMPHAFTASARRSAVLQILHSAQAQVYQKTDHSYCLGRSLHQALYRLEMDRNGASPKLKAASWQSHGGHSFGRLGSPRPCCPMLVGSSLSGNIT